MFNKVQTARLVDQNYQYKGKHIREWRKEQGLTYSQAAGLLGVSVRRVGYYENHGEYVPVPVQAILHLYKTIGITQAADLLSK